MTVLREALKQWKCPGCGGSGKYEQDAKGRARAEAQGKTPNPQYQPGPVTCRVCGGDGLNPIASAALREPRDDARGELLALADAGLRHAEGLSAQLERPDWKPSRAHIEQSRNSIKRLAEALRPALVPQCEAAPVAWPSVNEYVAGYEYRGDQDYAPNDVERDMIEDAIHGYLITCTPTTPPSRPDAGSVKARSHWAIEASIPEDGFECYYLLRDDITVAEICGHQTEQRGRHLDDLVFAANVNTSERKILASQAMEYARRLNDIAVNCEIAAFEGDASDLRRIAEWLATPPSRSDAGSGDADHDAHALWASLPRRTLVPPPSEAGREAMREALLAAKEFADDEFSDASDLPRKHRISVLCDKIDAALSPDPGAVAVASTEAG